jgi:hypothetical protein
VAVTHTVVCVRSGEVTTRIAKLFNVRGRPFLRLSEDWADQGSERTTVQGTRISRSSGITMSGSVLRESLAERPITRPGRTDASGHRGGDRVCRP